MHQPLTIVMLSMHTSPLAQPGKGDAGGMNVYVRSLTDALIRNGHQVLSFLRKSSPKEATLTLDAPSQSMSIPVAAGDYSLPKEALATLTSQFADGVIQKIQRYALHPVILHSHYWLSGIAALDITSLMGVPLVHTMHTLAASKNNAIPNTEPRYRAEREALIAAKATVLTANTQTEKAELIRYTPAKASRVVVVHPGVDHSTFSPRGTKHWPGRPHDVAPKVLFAGRLQPFKGPHILIDALALLRNKGMFPLPVIHFTGANSGDHNYDVRARAHLQGVSEHCSFSAPVSPAVLASHMRAADVVAIPSVAETFGLVAVEAQACGTPVIAHKAGGLTTAVKDRVSGRLLDSLAPSTWATTLTSLIQNSHTWQTYGKSAVEHSQQFSWEKAAGQLSEIYRIAIAQHRNKN